MCCPIPSPSSILAVGDNTSIPVIPVDTEQEKPCWNHHPSHKEPGLSFVLYINSPIFFEAGAEGTPGLWDVLRVWGFSSGVLPTGWKHFQAPSLGINV